MLERLQKIIARAGIASRRHAEELIQAGEVRVNGVVVTELGAKADPEHDRVEAAGKLAERPAQAGYYLLNKPAHVVSTMSDPEGRATLRHLLRGLSGGVFPVGRLDYAASGLVLLTTDGELADRIFKNSARMPQAYWIKVKGKLSDETLRTVRAEAHARLRLLRAPGAAGVDGANPWYEVEIAEARRDLLRNSLFALGHPVEKMKRVKFGPLDLGSLDEAHYRSLEPGEIEQLRQAIGRAEKAPRTVVGKRERRFRPKRAASPAARPEQTPQVGSVGANPNGRVDGGSSRPTYPTTPPMRPAPQGGHYGSAPQQMPPQRTPFTPRPSSRTPPTVGPSTGARPAVSGRPPVQYGRKEFQGKPGRGPHSRDDQCGNRPSGKQLPQRTPFTPRTLAPPAFSGQSPMGARPGNSGRPSVPYGGNQFRGKPQSTPQGRGQYGGGAPPQTPPPGRAPFPPRPFVPNSSFRGKPSGGARPGSEERPLVSYPGKEFRGKQTGGSQGRGQYRGASPQRPSAPGRTPFTPQSFTRTTAPGERPTGAPTRTGGQSAPYGSKVFRGKPATGAPAWHGPSKPPRSGRAPRKFTPPGRTPR